MDVQAALYDVQGNPQGEGSLPEALFGAKVSPVLLHEVVTAYQSRTHRGTACTKTRAEVRGGGRKPWKQKGTGNARAGSIRSPLWRKGGIIFGPRPRSFSLHFPYPKGRAALLQALSAKAGRREVAVIESFSITEPKTRGVAQLLRKMGVEGRTLLVTDNGMEILQRASRNMPDITVRRAQDLNAWGVLQADRLIFSRAALEALNQRLAIPSEEVHG